MATMGPAQLGIARNIVEGIWSRVKNPTTQQKLLAGGGAGNMVANILLGGGSEHMGFFGKLARVVDFALDAAAIASIFFAPIGFYVACGYGLKAAWHGINGVWCLTQRDLSGAMANFVTAGITLASILPVHKWKSIFNRSKNVFPMKGKALEEYLIKQTPFAKGKTIVFENESIELMEKNVIRLKGDGENGIVKGAIKKEEECVAAFAKKKGKLNEEITTNINKTNGHVNEDSSLKPEALKAEGLNDTHIKATQTKLEGQILQAEEELKLAKAALDAKNQEIKVLEEQVKRKELEEAKLNEIKKQVKENEEKIAQEKAKALKDAKAKRDKFANDVTELEETEKDLAIAKRRQTELEEAGVQAEKVIDDAKKLNHEYLKELERCKELSEERIAYYQAREKEILDDYNRSLVSVQMKPKIAIRRCVAESYGPEKGKVAADYYTEARAYCTGKLTTKKVAGEAVKQEVKEKVGLLTRIFRPIRKAWSNADPNKIAKAAEGTNPNISPVPTSATTPVPTSAPQVKIIVPESPRSTPLDKLRPLHEREASLRGSKFVFEEPKAPKVKRVDGYDHSDSYFKDVKEPVGTVKKAPSKSLRPSGPYTDSDGYWKA